MAILKQLFNKYRLYNFILVLTFTGKLFAGGDKSDSAKSFQFKWSNDFEYQTDYYYTNGFAFEYITPNADLSFIRSFMLPNSVGDLIIHSFTVLQDIFTPKAKFYIPDQLNGDRPFAAYILTGIKKTSFNRKENIELYSEIQIGVIGPMALGEEVQNGIHKMLPTSAEVEGWENQINNDILINYTASLKKFLPLNSWSNLFASSTVKLGLPYTLLNADFGTVVGRFDNLLNGFHFSSHKNVLLSFSLSAGISLVGYNATLQGGLFSNSVYTIHEINRVLGRATIGFTFKYKSLMCNYTQTFITSEFSKALFHSWGALAIEVKL